MRTLTILTLAGVLLAGCGSFGGSNQEPHKTFTIEPHAFVFYEGVAPVTHDGTAENLTGEVKPIPAPPVGGNPVGVAAPGVSSAQDAEGNSRCFIVTINMNDGVGQESKGTLEAKASANVSSPNSSANAGEESKDDEE